MVKRKSLWISLCLVNLCIVAFLGFTLRSKIVFPLTFINYRDVLSAHSHFAFAGWAGLSLIILLIYDLLPENSSRKNIYQWILFLMEVSSVGMVFTFPFYGYDTASIFFSTMYIVATLVFAPVFIKDILHSSNHYTVKILSISALSSLIISFLGTLGLAYILIARSQNSLLYRDSIYTFLHFQYNGFFTLSIFALLFAYLLKKGISLTRSAKLFAIYLCFSIVPALALSLLWHNSTLLYVVAAVGCVCILISLAFFINFFRLINQKHLLSSSIAITLWRLSLFSFCLKMLLNVGTIFPKLGNAVYGDRPVIIGFLHLVFLAFLTFYILTTFIENGFFTGHKKVIVYPFIVFSIGILLNEFLLMLQGLSILFKTNNDIYKWLLWGTSIILFSGAVLIAYSRVRIIKEKNKSHPL